MKAATLLPDVPPEALPLPGKPEAPARDQGGRLADYLALAKPRVGVLVLFTFVCYVGVYTPLKGRTTLDTLVGAVPGAMPPVIGWCAVRGEVTPEAVTLFVILFLWQVPHFLAIAWMYREEYARAGLLMLPV